MEISAPSSAPPFSARIWSKEVRSCRYESAKHAFGVTQQGESHKRTKSEREEVPLLNLEKVRS